MPHKNTVEIKTKSETDGIINLSVPGPWMAASPYFNSVQMSTCRHAGCQVQSSIKGNFIMVETAEIIKNIHKIILKLKTQGTHQKTNKGN